MRLITTVIILARLLGLAHATCSVSDWEEMIGCLDQDHISLNSDLWHNGTDLPPINKTLRIDGNDHTIHGNGNLILLVEDYGNVTLNRLVVHNASSGVENHGTITMNECKFEENIEYAIWNDDSLTLDRCHFHRNRGDQGGAIHTSGGTMTINDCHFFQNQAVDSGGAVWNGGTLSINECVFEENHATNGGGAIKNVNTMNQLKSTMFKGNECGDDGGGAVLNVHMGTGLVSVVGTEPPTTTIENCTFIQNVASGDGDGGAVKTNEQLVHVSVCVFEGNVGDTGGAVWNRGDNVTFDRCTFDENTASDDGGGVWNGGDHVRFETCEFTKNRGLDWGGALFSNGDECVIGDGEFTENVAKDGGAFYNQGMSASITNSIFECNECSEDVGCTIFSQNPLAAVGCEIAPYFENLISVLFPPTIADGFGKKSDDPCHPPHVEELLDEIDDNEEQLSKLTMEIEELSREVEDKGVTLTAVLVVTIVGVVVMGVLIGMYVCKPRGDVAVSIGSEIRMPMLHKRVV